jgi:hypothetical protein
MAPAQAAENGRVIVALVAAIITLLAAILRLAVDLRIGKKLLYTRTWHWIPVPAGALWAGSELSSVAELRLNLLNAGRDAVENLEIELMLGGSASVQLYSSRCRGITMQEPQQRDGRTICLLTIPLFNVDRVCELHFVCANAEADEPAVELEARNVKWRYVPPAAFLRRIRNEYATSKSIAEPRPLLARGSSGPR